MHTTRNGKRTLTACLTLTLGGTLFGSGCLPQNYWSDFLGSTLSAAVGQIIEDIISDTVDGVDPALDVNQV